MQPPEDSPYLESIALIRTLPCLAEPGRIIVIGQPSRSLDDVLPYLATLPDVITYDPQQGALTFRRQRGFLTLYPDRVYFTQVADVEEGLALLGALVEAINATWAERAALAPARAARRAPRMMDVWSLLPQTNCKACGEPTCMAFAVALIQGQRTVDECTPLLTDEALADRRATLQAML